MKKRTFFTLVELLIVIAIIAVLASLLMPALFMAKKTALKIKCTSQLKQMGYTVNCYGGDYNSYLPLSRGYTMIEGYYTQLYPYAPQLFSKKEYANGGVPSNPACPGMFNENGAEVGAAGNYVYYTSPLVGGYAMNNLCGYNCGGTVYPSKRISDYRDPSGTLMFCDAHVSYINQWGWDTTYSYAAFRHMNGLNILYIDSHCQWMKYSNSTCVKWTTD